MKPPNHPITTNLISSVVGFSAASFVVGLGFNLLTERSAKREAQQKQGDAFKHLLREVFAEVRQALYLMPEGSIEAKTDPPENMIVLSIEVMNKLDQMRWERRSAVEWLYQHADETFRNGVKPFAEEYLIPKRLMNRMDLLMMEECLREGRQVLADPESDPHIDKIANTVAKHNLKLFGTLMAKLLEQLVTLGYIR